MLIMLKAVPKYRKLQAVQVKFYKLRISLRYRRKVYIIKILNAVLFGKPNNCIVLLLLKTEHQEMNHNGIRLRSNKKSILIIFKYV